MLNYSNCFIRMIKGNEIPVTYKYEKGVGGFVFKDRVYLYNLLGEDLKDFEKWIKMKYKSNGYKIRLKGSYPLYYVVNLKG